MEVVIGKLFNISLWKMGSHYFQEPFVTLLVFRVPVTSPRHCTNPSVLAASLRVQFPDTQCNDLPKIV